MRDSWQWSLGRICVVALMLGVMVSGCGRTSTQPGGQVARRTTPTALPTEAATPTNAPEPIPTFTGCPAWTYGPTEPQYVAVGALSVSVPQRLQDHPSELMPADAPNAPYQLAAGAVTNFAPSPPVNPTGLSNGYIFQLCNETGAAYTITGVTVNIASFVPSSGPVAVWHLCQDGPYDTATKQTTTGCGGTFGGVGWLAATLPDDTTGASAPAMANAHTGGQSLPASIGPNEAIGLLIAINWLTSQGTYAFTFSISVDGATAGTLTPSDGPFLIAPSAAVWTGTACQDPAMQAHIPAASQDTYFVCPPAS